MRRAALVCAAARTARIQALEAEIENMKRDAFVAPLAVVPRAKLAEAGFNLAGDPGVLEQGGIESATPSSRGSSYSTC